MLVLIAVISSSLAINIFCSWKYTATKKEWCQISDLETPFSKVTTTTTLNLKTTPGKDTPDRPKFLPRYLRNLSDQYLTKRKNMSTGAPP